METVNRILIVYHREDNDGACSAGIVDAFYRKFRDDCDVKFKGVNYADLSRYWNEYKNADETWTLDLQHRPKIMKWLDFDEVYMLDISFNELAAMEFMIEQLKEHFVWCDHHKPIIELSKEWSFGSANGIRRTDQSALMNTWDFLCEKFGLPDAKASNEMIKLSDYDSWAWTRKPEYDEQARENLFDLNVGITHRSNLNPKWFSDWIFNWLDSEFSYRNAAGSVHYHTACEAQIFGHQVRELDKKRTDFFAKAPSMMLGKIPVNLTKRYKFRQSTVIVEIEIENLSDTRLSGFTYMNTINIALPCESDVGCPEGLIKDGGSSFTQSLMVSDKSCPFSISVVLGEEADVSRTDFRQKTRTWLGDKSFYEYTQLRIKKKLSLGPYEDTRLTIGFRTEKRKEKHNDTTEQSTS